MECRSVEKMQEVGIRPFWSLPSLSPNSCLYHSFIIVKSGSKQASVSTLLPLRYRMLRVMA